MNVLPLRRAACLGLLVSIASCQTKAANPDVLGNAPIPAGVAEQTADLQGVSIEVFTYRPAGCALSGVLMVFHGLDRNADAYRDYVIPLGQRFCLLVVAPLFDAARFPTWRYQRGGMVHDGSVQPAESWTVNLVPRLASWIRHQEGRPELPYALIGHSAGGQFLSRVVAFGNDEAKEIVIANPSTWVRPSLEIAAPYGFGGVFGPQQGEAALRRYLAAKVTVLLGQEDVGSRNLATSEEAEEQGSTRFERGQTVFREAADAARRHGCAFNWHLAAVPGVGHNARAMFTSEQAFAALRPF
ncbi:MAG: hypothetical protein WA709_29260 [Stellaceae bacterium]